MSAPCRRTAFTSGSVAYARIGKCSFNASINSYASFSLSIMVRTPLRGLGKHGLYGNGRILNTRLRNAMGQSDMHVKRHRIGLAVSKHSRRLKCAERASVRHTDAFSGRGQRDATAYQSITAKRAAGCELD